MQYLRKECLSGIFRVSPQCRRKECRKFVHYIIVIKDRYAIDKERAHHCVDTNMSVGRVLSKERGVQLRPWGRKKN